MTCQTSTPANKRAYVHHSQAVVRGPLGYYYSQQRHRFSNASPCELRRVMRNVDSPRVICAKQKFGPARIVSSDDNFKQAFGQMPVDRVGAPVLGYVIGVLVVDRRPVVPVLMEKQSGFSRVCLRLYGNTCHTLTALFLFFATRNMSDHGCGAADSVRVARLRHFRVVTLSRDCAYLGQWRGGRDAHFPRAIQSARRYCFRDSVVDR